MSSRKLGPADLSTVLDEISSRYSVAMLGELRLVEKKINGCNPAIPGNDEIRTSARWRVSRSARYPLDPPPLPSSGSAIG
jgi:hypothetical protein